MTGYHDPPAGVEVKEGLHYNPYFNGGWIGMAKALYDEIIEYSDGKLEEKNVYDIKILFFLFFSSLSGTPATQSQLAKDVATFLAWSTEKSHDDKKKLTLKVLFPGFFFLLSSIFIYITLVVIYLLYFKGIFTVSTNYTSFLDL